MDHPDLDLALHPAFLGSATADAIFERLKTAIAWRQDAITLFGKTHPLPRLHQWYADPGLTYRWSGLAMEPLPWTADLLEVKQAIEDHVSHSFNSVLANLYRDGRDAMGWHSDDEPELGEHPVIASLSLGATRDFRLRHRSGKASPVTLALTHGSLLIMRGSTQHAWQHSLPRRARCQAERINLTFRTVV